jgi:hypothetical protein
VVALLILLEVEQLFLGRKKVNLGWYRCISIPVYKAGIGAVPFSPCHQSILSTWDKYHELLAPLVE